MKKLVKVLSKVAVVLDGKKFTLVSVPMIPTELVVAKKIEQLHNIHILDISGSMTWNLPKLKEDVLESVEKMQDGDLLSIVLLTSHDRCKVLLKGVELTKNSRKNVSTLVNKLDTMGCTCFSEPLKLTRDIVADLKDLCPDFYISLFTDGTPVVPWSDKEEISRCLAVIDEMKENISVIDTIGYGNYYDSELLKAISSATEGGKYTHAGTMQEYRSVIDTGYDTLRNSIRTQLPVSGKGKILFLSGKNTIFNENELNITTLSEEENSIIFLLDEDATEIVIGSETVKVADIKNVIEEDEIEDYMYLLSKEEAYKGDLFAALDMLDFIGDVGLIVQVNNSFTKEEKQNALNNIALAIKDKDRRFMSGKEHGTLGDSDAFSLVDLLNYLRNEKAYLRHETFENYNRIGVKTVAKVENFKTTEIKPVPLTDISFNEKRANISVMFTYQGLVTLNDPEKTSALGLDKIYMGGQVPSVKYRNYAIIKDGEINIETLKLIVTPEVVEKLKTIKTLVGKGDLVTAEETMSNGLVKVDINVKALPIISRKYAKAVDFKPVYDMVKEVFTLKSRKKAVRYMLKELVGDSKESFKLFTQEQIDYLKENGLNQKLEWSSVDYQATKENIADADTYVARTLEFKIKGASAQPDTKKVMEAMDKGKKFTKFSEVAMVETIKLMREKLEKEDARLITDNLSEEGIKALEKEILETKEKILKDEFDRLDKIDKEKTLELNTIKLAKIITNTLWNDLVPDEKADFIYDDVQIFLKKELVPFTS